MLHFCRPRLAAYLWVSSALVSSAYAQLPAARLNASFPPGGKQGSAVEVTLSGTDLEQAAKLHFSHPGLTAVLKAGTENQFVVTVAPDAPLGLHELRVVGRYGISNPRAFVVGSLPETIETEPNNAAAQANEATIGSTVNGQANAATDIDWFKFNGVKGQRVLVDGWAQRIDSRMDATLALYDDKGRELAVSRDAVRRDPLLDVTLPADGAYFIKAYDFTYGGGPEYFYRLNIGVGPHLDFIFPAAGQPGTTGKFTIYGRNLPGGVPAEKIAVEGRPLEKLAVEIAVPNGAAEEQIALNSLLAADEASIDGFEYRLAGPQGLSNPLLIGFAKQAAIEETEPNSVAAQAQRLSLPCEVAGQFFPRGDKDWFAFDAKKGEVFWFEVISQRHGLPTDPQLLVQRVTKNDKGEENVGDLQEVDDVAAQGQPLFSFDVRSDDPAYRFTAPDDGQYRLLLGDLYQRGDPRYVYRLIVRPETPDFRLAAVPTFPNPQANQTNPWTTFLRKGGSAAVQVVALRRDNFDGEIRVSAVGLPAGVTCQEAVLGPGQKTLQLVLNAAEDAADWAGVFQLVGKATIGDKEIVREARAGSVVWPAAQNQPNAPADARLARNLALAVCGAESAPLSVNAAETKTWEMSRAGKFEIPLKVARRNDFKGPLQLKATGLPPNVKVNDLTIDAAKDEGKLQVEFPNNAPLGAFTFSLTAQTQVSYRKNVEQAAAAEEAKKEADKLVTELTEASKKATQAKQDADKFIAEATAAQKQAVEAKPAAEKSLAEALAAATAAGAPADAAAKELQAAEALVAALRAVNDAATKVQATIDAKAAAEKAVPELAEKLKAAQAAQAAATKKATDLANSSKPNNLPVFEPVAPITIKVTAAPITVNAPTAVSLQQGQKAEATVSFNRLYGYADAVELEPIVPGGAGGLKVAKITVPSGQSEGKLAFEADAKAVAGTHQIAVKGTAKFNGQNLQVETTLLVTIQAAPSETK